MAQAAKNSYTPMTGLAETVSLVDGEESVPQSLRTAQRRAAWALAAAGLAFFASASVAVVSYASARHIATAAPAAAATEQGSRFYQEPLKALPKPPPELSRVEDSKQALAMMADAMSNMDLDDIMTPQRYVLVAPAVLHNSLGESSPVIQELPSGTRVFPLRHRMGWMEVLVADKPQHAPQEKPLTVANAVAGFGWLPMQKDGVDMLRKDEIKAADVKWDQKPVSPEDLTKRWAQVREENSKLKASLANLQVSMQAQMVQHLKEQGRQARPTAAAVPQAAQVALASAAAPELATAAPQLPMNLHEVAEEAKESVNVEELKKDASVLEKDVAQELQDVKPKEILNDLGSIFR